MPDEPSGAGARRSAELTWPWLIALHLAPGVAFWGVLLLLQRIVEAQGGTTYLALILTIPLCLVPLELGIMLFWSKRTTGKASLRAATGYRGRPGVLETFVIPALLLALFLLMSVATGPLSVWLEGQITWISQGLKSGAALQQLAATSPIERTVTFILAALFSGFAAPIVEEIYFRGFLLPRMESLGWAAPVLNAFLFALYHFYLPWNVPAILMAWIPVAIVVRMRKNYVIGITVHSAINLLAAAQLFALSSQLARCS